MDKRDTTDALWILVRAVDRLEERMARQEERVEALGLHYVVFAYGNPGREDWAFEVACVEAPCPAGARRVYGPTTYDKAQQHADQLEAFGAQSGHA